MNFNDAEAHRQITVRENLQNLFDRCFLSENCKGLREHYKALRRLELNEFADFTTETVDIASLVENLTIACDILTADAGINFIFCGNDTARGFCNGKALTKSVLNLLSNAYLHSTGNLITVKTVETNNHIKIEVKNEGAFHCEHYGKGLSFVSRACSLFGGSFFVVCDLFSTTAVILIEKAPAKNCKDFYVPDFYEYLNDRLSPVYVEMFGMEYH